MVENQYVTIRCLHFHLIVQINDSWWWNVRGFFYIFYYFAKLRSLFPLRLISFKVFKETVTVILIVCMLNFHIASVTSWCLLWCSSFLGWMPCWLNSLTTANTGETAFTLVEAVSPTITSYFHLADRQNICQAGFSCALHTFLVVSCSFSSEINSQAPNKLGKQLTL